jgi:hypothetical protein
MYPAVVPRYCCIDIVQSSLIGGNQSINNPHHLVAMNHCTQSVLKCEEVWTRFNIVTNASMTYNNVAFY